MAAINDLIEQIDNQELRILIQKEVDKMNKQRKFGLVFEGHTPENTPLYDVPIKKGSPVVKRGKGSKEMFVVLNIDRDNALCEHTVSHEQVTMATKELVSVARLGDPIYPYLKPMGKVQNAPDDDLWHTLIEADNYHALQFLVYLYAGQVDCIYIDPPYNKADSHDWKYNCDYVDGKDMYRHSKWLSMIEKRLLLAKKLLNTNDSVLIVTIDEMEYHHLGCLLEQLFPEANIQMVSSVINPGGVPKTGQFYRTNEYIYFVKFGSMQPSALQLNQEWFPGKGTGYAAKGKVRWRPLRRDGAEKTRKDRPKSFFPIYVNNDCTRFLGFGDCLPLDLDWHNVPVKENCHTIWPILPDGSDGRWNISGENMKELFEKGFLNLGHLTSEYTTNTKYLPEGERDKVLKGVYSIEGKRIDGSLILSDSIENNNFVPGTQWRITSHDATLYGTKLMKNIIGERFTFPKSLYAVHDAIRFFMENKPKALILDFFAGSGTTLQAVNLLNAEDGGHRRCIMVTNNEIGETKEDELLPQGINPGDEEWEKWGIARYVNWPRTECSIKGVDVKGNPIDGDYITTKMEERQSNRKITQIDFLVEDANLAKKKKLVTFINKQKAVKLPSIKEDVKYLIAEDDDSCNASIIFDTEALNEWLDALDGHDEITNIYVVTNKATIFGQIKDAVNAVLGQIEESVPVKMPMKDGFKTNAIYFKLGFLDKTAVALGRQFKELLPILWMKTGARGDCPELDSNVMPQMLIFEKNHFAVLVDETAYHEFELKIRDKGNVIDTVFFVTDSNRGFKEMSESISVSKTYQLYRDYLDNFRINNIK